jgi:curved DNA-binding protein CbpA
MDFKDYYEILGVAPNAEKKVIQQTFRQLARKVHPDVNPGNKENSRRSMRPTRFYRMRNSARSMMSCGLNTSNGSRRAAANRISTGKTGQLNRAKARASNTPVRKTWKTSSEAHHRIPTSSPISLDRRTGAAEAVAKLLRPAHVADGMSSTKLT